MMNKISAVIITLNEEKNIARCLTSLQGIADEIVIVDSGSTDKTADICHAFGVKWVHQDWLGYGKQKNVAAAQATHQWILSLDADEALSDDLRESLIQFKQSQQITFDAYSLSRRTNYCGKWIYHCGWYPDKKIRLWRQGCAQWTTPRVHETIQLASGAKLGYLQGDLLHYTYYSIAEHIAVSNKYTTLVAEEMVARGRKTSWFKIFFNPPFCFFRDYFLRRGFLDGYYGFVICMVATFSTFLKYTKLKQMNDGQHQKKVVEK